ncbi:polysaccharide biosynthesis/export family protein [Chryseolinea sp. Jin1]|uniref:Polysaccharide biosynthesis/export family protein n=2 Tax=Chryseolinea lacunae TaxID=2801331 RepID=A0ABS1KLH8_9BACT|nr:polysaccharide biosynthesis/export family protein [Chryseolinea lacunae]MBL0740072.1 polysaccharide biosynthesis/export family protein [Chryseolinea lacunae]
MFRLPEGQALKQQTDEAEKNYVIQKNDYLTIEVYTSKGERLIDPDAKLVQETRSQETSSRPVPTYLVDVNGVCKFPMVGETKVEGLSIRQAEEVLQQAYGLYYQQSFVVLRYTNKRVVVLGAPGGQVIPLVNENMHLVEVLALAKGVSNDAKAHNIRVLRGKEVFLADLTTFDGYLKNNITIEPGDVIYVEPIRRPFTEAVRDYGPVISILTSLTTLVVVLFSIN